MMDIDRQSYLPNELLDKIFKNLSNFRDLRVARNVCRDWCRIATPLFLQKIDEITIDLGATNIKSMMYHRALFDKYREKQRQIPNRKLSQIDMEDIYKEIASAAEIFKGSESDTTSLLSTYCDYIESGETIKYTNFDLSGITLGCEVVSRFFTLCGGDIKTLVLTIYGNNNYYYACSRPIEICAECQDIIQKGERYVIDRSRLKALVFKYCPNLENLTLDWLASPKDETGAQASKLGEERKEGDTNDESDTDDESDTTDEKGSMEDEIMEDESIEMGYLMRYGDIASPRLYDLFKDVIDLPPSTNIHTIRIADRIVAQASETPCVFDMFLASPKLMRVSNFGMRESAWHSFTFDFLRSLVCSRRMDTITDLFLRHVDSVVLGSVLSLYKDRFHLKFLKVNYLKTHTAEYNLLQFLEGQSSTLETIMFGLTQKKNPQWLFDKIRFPKQMPKLTHLRIGLGTQKNDIFDQRPPKQVARIDWKKQFPSLKTLMLPELASNVTIASFFEHSHASEPLTTVTGLELPAGLTANLMSRAGFLFPNVTQLAVGYQTVDSLRQIWVMWPQLESLHLSVVDHNKHGYNPDIAFLSLDALLTGFDDVQMKLAKDGQQKMIDKPKFPSIANLKYLRELTIYAAPYRTHSDCQTRVNWKTVEADVVTDISMIHALMKLPSLKYLDISEQLHKISPVVDIDFCDSMKLLHEDNVNYRKNYTVMIHYRGREEAHPMCRHDVAYKDK